MNRGKVLSGGAGRFEIEEVAAAGGMATVYRAREQTTGRLVAIKVLRGGSATDEQRMQREAELLAHLRHPAIVQYLDRGLTEEAEPFVVMEWLEGETLAERLLRQRGLTLHESLELVRGVGEALGAAHASGIVHRDVKPSNIFLLGGAIGAVRVLDFGIARPGYTSRRMTQTGALVGTLGYMAPEQAAGGHELDARADVFSLGCVFHECLTGQPALAATTDMGVLVKLLFDETPRVRAIRPEVPAAIDDLVARMMARDPAGRPRDASQVLHELAALALADLPPPQAGPGAPPGHLAAGAEVITSHEMRLLGLIVLRPPALSSLPRPLPLPTSSRISGGNRVLLECLRDAVAPFGAQLERLPDGTVVAALLGSSSATDLAIRAARCALAMRRAAPSASLGVATVHTEMGGRISLGDAVSSVMALAVGPGPGDDEDEDEACGPVGIRIDAVTRNLLDARFEVAPARDRAGGYFLLGEVRGDWTATRQLLGQPTPCVGRERELLTVGGCWQECLEEGLAQAILVTGPPGVGKSRLGRELVRELWERPEEVLLWFGQGDFMSADMPLGLLGQLVRHATGIREGELPAERHVRLLDAVQALGLGEVQRVAAFLGELAGVAWPPGIEEPPQLRVARHNPSLMGTEVRRAFSELLGAAVAQRPLAIVIDDLQWVDPLSVQALDAVLRDAKDRPLLILALARPEVGERYPRLWMERRLHHLRLSELSRRASERLARQVLGETVDPGVIQRVVEQSQGNAFFLEECLRAAAEGRGGALPETVLAMVAVRLGGLDTEARRTIRAASVFGEVFWGEGVAALLGGAARSPQAAQGETERWLQLLMDYELITRRRESRFPGQTEYAFRHALVREAAYAMLTPKDRERGHRLAAEWLAAVGEPDAARIARHLELGHERKHAAAAYAKAAAQAFKLGDCDVAFALAEEAAACGAESALLGEIRLIELGVWFWRGDFDAALRAGGEALERLTPASPAWFHAMSLMLDTAYVAGAHERLLGLVDPLVQTPVADELARRWQLRGLAAAITALVRVGQVERAAMLAARIESALLERELEPEFAGRVHEALGLYLQARGEPSRARSALLRAAVAYETVGETFAATNARIEAALAMLWLGGYGLAETELVACLATAVRIDSANLQYWVRFYQMVALVLRGAFDEALGPFAQVEARLEALGNQSFLAIGRMYQASIFLALGRYEEAERAAREAVGHCVAPSPWRCMSLGMLARVLLGTGRPAEALARAREAMALLEELGTCPEGKEAEVRLVYVEALAATGDAAGARAALAAARRRLRTRADMIHEAAWRRSFLEEVKPHARTLALAREWLGAEER
ncbi:MAG TPA: protein kinase [Polyangia bacterium]|nr:protein kinase [Polyangia bacterium]